MAVGGIQGKSRFTVEQGESRNTTIAEGGILVSDKNSVKSRCDISWFKNHQGVVPLPNQPNLFLIFRVIKRSFVVFI